LLGNLDRHPPGLPTTGQSVAIKAGPSQTLIFLAAPRPTRCSGEEARPAMLKKVLLWGGLAFLILFIAYNPSDAADVVRALGNGLVNMAQGFGDFFSELVA
jgi:hypothetical protein